MSLVEKALQKIQSQSGKPALPQVDERGQASKLQPGVAASGSFGTSGGLQFVPHGPAIGIDIANLRKSGLIPDLEQERVVMRQLRAVKQSLLRKIASDPVAPLSVPRTVMVTSGLPGDGKTFTSLNLALSLAREKDLKILLVDADMPKPHITSVLGLKSQRGLIDVVSETDTDVASIVRATSVPGLYFVPAGVVSDEATELLSSGRMTSVVRRLANLGSNWIIVFDSPPTLVTNEAQALAALMSQILVVVRAGATPQTVVSETIAILGASSASISLLLNDAKSSSSGVYSGEYAYGFEQQDGQKNSLDSIADR